MFRSMCWSSCWVSIVAVSYTHLPSDVILFNIDSKSDSNGKENKDAIVNVFLKVFNEMQGFCGSMPHLADLERRLSEEGRFEEFKEKFEEEYGLSLIHI